MDPASWQPQVGGHGWGNQELQYYTDGSANAALDGAGNLAITVRRTDPQLRDRRFGGCPYTSARLVTKDRVSFTYGLVQARIRLPPGTRDLARLLDARARHRSGRLAAVWRDRRHGDLRQGPDSRPRDSPRPGLRRRRRHHRLLPGRYQPVPTTSTSTRSTGNPDAIRWYLNDHLYSTVTPGDLQGRPWVFDHDFFLLLNVAVGGTFSVTPDPSTAFPQTMLVDWIRIYASTPNSRS